MNTYIPRYLTEKRNLIWQVLGTALFGEVFILVFKPFESYSWAGERFLLYALYATMVVLVAMGVVAISRTILCYFAKRREVTVLDYVIWHIAEFSAMSIIYTIFAVVLGKSNTWDDFGELFKLALLYTSLIMLLPYALFILYFSLKDKKEQLEKVRLEQGQQTEAGGAQKVDEMLNFKDEKGELKLSIRLSSLCYIESADNYVTIYYENGGKMQKYMLRSSLKRLEEEMEQRNVVRCHRSYIVNFSRVQVLRKGEDGLLLDLGIDKTIPVSKTYSGKILERFTENG